jgi:homoserine kinase
MDEHTCHRQRPFLPVSAGQTSIEYNGRMSSITVTVPATTANLGPGFDCLGLALGLHNEVTLTPAESGLEVAVEGEGAGLIPAGPGNLVLRAADRVFEQVGRRPAGLRLRQRNAIPVGSGLGSSAAATLAGILAANALVDGRLSRNDVLHLATELEGGHADNVAPALVGGLVLVMQEAGEFILELVRLPDFHVAVVLPELDLPTAVARAALPPQVPLADAIFNAARTALLIRALAEGDYAKIGRAMHDRLHQPYRLPLIPGMAAAFVAARQAGAAGVALSGAGPSLIAFAPTGHEQIAAAASAAFHQAGLPARSWLLAPDHQGALVRQSAPSLIN